MTLAAHTDAQCQRMADKGNAEALAELVKRGLRMSKEQHAEALRGKLRLRESKDGWRENAWGSQ